MVFDLRDTRNSFRDAVWSLPELDHLTPEEKHNLTVFEAHDQYHGTYGIKLPGGSMLYFELTDDAYFGEPIEFTNFRSTLARK